MNQPNKDRTTEPSKRVKCEHKFIHKESDKRCIINDRSCSRSKYWVQIDVYFCEKCLKEEIKKREWCGVPHESGRPGWTKLNGFRTIEE